MKKSYQKPYVKSIEIESANLLAGSDTLNPRPVRGEVNGEQPDDIIED